ncbi:hypothetical protein Bca52824_016389 [Brassica carinata]|uniref:Uncharacterized protein n=1 Tax=Brassica carinata TaxID=52824 RepID=A0A8X7W4D0_BRACI|nr:hypothetical protein Bca52824_016389 [Brassica carinata]
MLISTWMCAGRMSGSASPRGTGRMDKRRYTRPQGRGTCNPRGNGTLAREPERAGAFVRDGRAAREVKNRTDDTRGTTFAEQSTRAERTDWDKTTCAGHTHGTISPCISDRTDAREETRGSFSPPTDDPRPNPTNPR